jgi:hypothetical protein
MGGGTVCLICVTEGGVLVGVEARFGRESAFPALILLGCVSFAGFFAHFKEKIAGSDFSRRPRRGKAQGCAEQIGSDASPSQIKITNH